MKRVGIHVFQTKLNKSFPNESMSESVKENKVAL